MKEEQEDWVVRVVRGAFECSNMGATEKLTFLGESKALAVPVAPSAKRPVPSGPRNLHKPASALLLVEVLQSLLSPGIFFIIVVMACNHHRGLFVAHKYMLRGGGEGGDCRA